MRDNAKNSKINLAVVMLACAGVAPALAADAQFVAQSDEELILGEPASVPMTAPDTSSSLDAPAPSFSGIPSDPVAEPAKEAKDTKDAPADAGSSESGSADDGAAVKKQTGTTEKANAEAKEKKALKAKKAKAAAAPKPSAAPVATPTGELLAVDFAYEDAERGFTMQVPTDWSVQKDYAGYQLFAEPKVKAEPSADNPVVADPNLTVAVVRAPMHIDATSLEEYGKNIVEKFKATNGAGTDVQIFQKQVLDTLPGGKRGLLYYMTYRKNGFDVVSAVLIMSNEKAMYRVTLTDYKVGFDKTLERLYPIMASLTITGEPPARVNPWLKVAPWAGAGAGALALMMILRAMNNRRMRKAMEEVMSEGDGGYMPSSRAPHSQMALSQAPLSHAGSMAPMSAAAAPASMAPTSTYQSVVPLDEDVIKPPPRRPKKTTEDEVAELEEAMYSRPPVPVPAPVRAVAGEASMAPMSGMAPLSEAMNSSAPAPNRVAQAPSTRQPTPISSMSGGFSEGPASVASASMASESVVRSNFAPPASHALSVPLSQAFPFDDDQDDGKASKKKKKEMEKAREKDLDKAPVSADDDEEFSPDDIGFGK